MRFRYEKPKQQMESESQKFGLNQTFQLFQ
jgi:hypothetical protein